MSGSSLVGLSQFELGSRPEQRDCAFGHHQAPELERFLEPGHYPLHSTPRLISRLATRARSRCSWVGASNRPVSPAREWSRQSRNETQSRLQASSWTTLADRAALRATNRKNYFRSRRPNERERARFVSFLFATRSRCSTCQNSRTLTCAVGVGTAAQCLAPRASLSQLCTRFQATCSRI